MEWIIDNSFLLVALPLGFVSIHFAVISYLPKFLTKKFVAYCHYIVNKNNPTTDSVINVIAHFGPVGYYSREVIIPCPDFIYSGAHFKLDASSVQILQIPRGYHFQNLAFYDFSARCLCSKSLINSNKWAVVVGPSVFLSDEEILSSLPSCDNGYEVMRVPLNELVFMHRLFLHYRTKYEEYKKDQLKFVCTRHALPPTTATPLEKAAPAKKSRNSDVVVVGVVLSLFALVAHLYRHLVYKSCPADTVSRHSLIAVGLYVVVAAAGVATAILKVLKIRDTKDGSGVAKNTVRGPWKFTYLTIDELSWNPYLSLYWFIYGAFGLPNDLVQYGSTHSDSDGAWLQADKNYLIECETSDFHCEWWSFTVYAYDQFLVVNEEHLYSKNSVNVFIPMEESKGTSRPEGEAVSRLKEKRLQIYCSQERPHIDSPYYGLPWLPLTSQQRIQEKEDSLVGLAYLKKQLSILLSAKQENKKAMQFIIRFYSPDPAFWGPNQELSLPSIRSV